MWRTELDVRYECLIPKLVMLTLFLFITYKRLCTVTFGIRPQKDLSGAHLYRTSSSMMWRLFCCFLQIFAPEHKVTFIYTFEIWKCSENTIVSFVMKKSAVFCADVFDCYKRTDKQ